MCVYMYVYYTENDQPLLNIATNDIIKTFFDDY